MRPFEYASPTMLGQAVSLLASPGSVPLAGGSDLLALMKDGVETPGRLVNLKDIRDLRGIRLDPKAGLKIGALVTIDELAADPALRFDYGALADAAGRVAGPQIRNVATVGGNLCQRPRCWYFRNGFGLLPTLNGKSMVIEGDNRYHSILGNDGPAAFVSPSTIVPLLVALGTQVTIAGLKGERKVDLESFYRAPRNPGEREHDLAPGEIVTSITVAPVAGRKLASYEVRQRETLDWSLATAAVTLEMDGRLVTKARVVLGQVAPIPWTSKEAEAILQGQTLDRALAQKAGEAAVQGAKPLSRNRYKVQLARVAVQRALLAAAGMGA
ncbi:MAG TPA: xanthine dehydrogenase family protein subunit M [Thermoanaerobaculia bacterium]|nr:xanthine dehydrogenase family protein subunit M [Thermoanaerobaculia bacterium]